MEIILKKDYTNLGYKGEILKVKPGFARNFLIPQGIAIISNKGNRKSAEHDIKQAKHKALAIKQKALEIADKIKDKLLKIKVKASEGGKIFGSVTNLQISQAILSEYKIDINPKNIFIKNSIKSLGKFEINIQLHKDVNFPIKIEIIPE